MRRQIVVVLVPCASTCMIMYMCVCTQGRATVAFNHDLAQDKTSFSARQNHFYLAMQGCKPRAKVGIGHVKTCFSARQN